MKNNKTIYILIVIFSFFLITNTKALENEEFKEKIQETQIKQVLKNGWETENDKKYYYENGERISGFKEIDGETYFFGLTKKYMLTGWQSINGKRFYLDSTGKITQGWNEIEGKKYYVENNYMISGFKEIDGETYFFGLTKNYMLTGWQSINGKRFYLDSIGKITQGWNEIEGKKYYVENNYMISGFKEIDGETYFFGLTKNYMLTGWQSLGNNKYFYSNPDGTVAVGNQNIDGRDYAIGTDGIIQGFKVVNGRTYYYNPDSTMAKGMQRIAGQYFLFDTNDGFFIQIVQQKMVIDISSHNGVIDWEAVKKSGLVDAVILRLGVASNGLDTQFLRNAAELERLNIPYSVYLFSYAENGTEALGEANFVINTIKNNGLKLTNNIPIYYDLEDWENSYDGHTSYGISKESYRDMINTFIYTVEANLLLKARVYASKSYITDRFSTDVQQYATWVAQWGPACTYTGPYEGWQYTSSGSVPGIGGRVDMSIFYY